MKNNLPTEAGQTNPNKSQNNATANDVMIDAINQVFALFKLNYHNQFYKAFTQSRDLNSTKRLWLESLQKFTPDTLLRGAKSIMQTSEFLPTLHTMIKHCEAQSLQALPNAHSAYIEACRAPSPKADYVWTHPAVYHAGKKTDWYFLQNNPERVAFPIFKQAYQDICERVMRGDKLTQPNALKLPAEPEPKIDKKISEEHLSKLKAFLSDDETNV